MPIVLVVFAIIFAVKVVVCTCTKDDNSHALHVDGAAVVVEHVLNSVADAGKTPGRVRA